MFYRQKGLKMTKLTHPPFNRWLLSGEPLSPEQNTILQEHLRYCPECSQLQAAWGEAQLQLSSAGQVAPAPGFTRRFQQRLALQRVKRQRRSSWMLFLGAAGIPTYGIGALFFEPDLGGVHGLNERIRVQSLYDGRDYLYELVKLYAAGAGP